MSKLRSPMEAISAARGAPAPAPTVEPTPTATPPPDPALQMQDPWTIGDATEELDTLNEIDLTDAPGSAPAAPAAPAAPPAPGIDPPPVVDPPNDRETNLARMRESYEEQLRQANQQQAQLIEQSKKQAEELARLNIRYDPQYVQKIEKPIQETISKIGIALEEIGVAEDVRAELLKGKTSEILGYVQDNHPNDAPMIQSYLGDLQRLSVESRRMIQEWEKTTAEFRKENEERERALVAQSREQRQKLVVDALGRLETARFLPFTRTGEAAWDQKVQKLANLAFQVVNSDDADLQVEMMIRGASAQALHGAYLKERELREMAEAELQRMGRAIPRASGAAPAVGAPAPQKTVSPREAWDKNVT